MNEARMHLYRKVIPKIAREIVRTLNSKGDIMVDDGQLDEAELDLAAVMVEHCNQEDRISQEAKDAISRRGLPQERFQQVKKSLADARGVKLADDGIEEVINQMIEALFTSKNIAEVFAEDNVLRKFFKEVMVKYLSVDEDLDREARGRLKNLREGTVEWDIEYERTVAQLKRQKGLL
ncbi:MAG: DUF507 family protein [Deltaproteobacteria bacterium]|nr:DUF507 family protein [Deltaproteobacteria bacterium]